VNWKGLTLLVVLTIGMLIYLQFGVIQKSEKKEIQKETEAKIFKDLNGLKRIIIRNTREPEIVLTQEDSRWNIEKPIQDIVSTSQLETFLAGLKNLEIKSVLLENAEFESRKLNLDQYGLKPDSYQIELDFSAGPKTIVFGDMLGETFDFYARLGTEPRILIVSSDIESSRTLGAQDWREKKLVNVDASQILRISIDREKDTLEFERPAVGKAWEMKSPFRLPLDQEFTNNRLQKISIVQANSFLDQLPSALRKPSIRVKALFTDGTRDARSTLEDPLPQGVEVIFGRSLRIGSKNKDAGDDYDYFAKSDKAPAAQIARFHFENFDRPARDFVEKKFDDFLSLDVKSFKVWQDGKLILSARREDESVSLEAHGKQLPGSELSYEKALQHLRNLVASQFVTPDSKPKPQRVGWMVELEMKDKTSRYFAFENPYADGSMWTSKNQIDLRYQFRANALNPKLFSLDSLTHPPIESLKKAPASKPDLPKKGH